ncbi:hypothetical protein FRC08_001014 [Ceratobasidium sp. 394]|nr:hypothetical protein FRC08_001014 [Ceratobasidium sp. 394]
MILSAPGGHCGCTVYSWVEAIYTRASGQSFRDLLLSSKGWNQLYGVLLDLFGSEEHFILGPYMIQALQAVPNPPSSLVKTLQLEMLEHQPPCGVTFSQRKLFDKPWNDDPTLFHSGFIDNELIEHMYLVNCTILDKPLSEDVEMHEGVPVRLSNRRAELLRMDPNDFFYDDYVKLVNRTAKLVDEVPADDSSVEESSVEESSIEDSSVEDM